MGTKVAGWMAAMGCAGMAMVAGCGRPGGSVTPIVDVSLASQQGQSVIVGQLDPTSHIDRIDVYQDGWRVGTVRPVEDRGGDRYFSMGVWPGLVELRAHIGVVVLGQSDGLRRELPVNAKFVSWVEVPSDSVVYVGRLYDVAWQASSAEATLDETVIASEPEPSSTAGQPWRVFVRAVDEWSGQGGPRAYLERRQPEAVRTFGRVLTGVCPTWTAH